MQTKVIQIDDLIIRMADGKAFRFPSKFSQKDLSGINLNFSVDNTQGKMVEEIFQRDQVTVIDPFTGQTYQARVSFKPGTPQSGEADLAYIAELKELDLPPKVQRIELNRTIFQIIDYTEAIDNDGNISIKAVLKLSKDELNLISELAKNETVAVRRLNILSIDNEPLKLKLQEDWWSEHETDYTIYFKQIIRLTVPKEESKATILKSLNMLMLNQQNAIIDAQVRYEALINLLIKKQILTHAEAKNLLEEELEKLVEAGRFVQIKREMRKVSDAELEV